MPITNTQDSYGSVTKFFHWSIAALIILMIILGFIMTSIERGPLRSELLMIHKSTGLLLLVLIVLRICWRLVNKTPALPSHIPRWQQIVAHASHGLLYLVLLAMPISGLIYSTAAGYPPTFYNLFLVQLPIAKNKALATFAGDTHEVLAWTLVALISIHILAALKHHFIDKSDILKRMAPAIAPNANKSA